MIKDSWKDLTFDKLREIMLELSDNMMKRKEIPSFISESMKNSLSPLTDDEVESLALAALANPADYIFLDGYGLIKKDRIMFSSDMNTVKGKDATVYFFEEQDKISKRYPEEQRLNEIKKVKSKAVMYDLYDNGRLGNVLPYEKSINDVVNKKGTIPWAFSLRYSVSNARSLNLPMYSTQIYDFAEAHNIYWLWVNRYNCDPNKILVFIPPNDQKVILQGEVGFVNGNYHLLYSTVKAQMLPALKQDSRIMKGPRVMIVLKSLMDEPSYNNLRELLDKFPDHVVEFSIFSYRQGTMMWNTLFWELRKY